MPKENRLTDQQRRAVATRRVSVVLSSGAGCGKTTVLTERYLSHLRDDGAEVGQVVAITFTDRAARQMRKRIRTEVEKQLDGAKTDDAATDTWTRHLRSLETAPISTIHAFCGALLRQHAVEAGIDPRFDVLEEVLSVNLEGEALNSCLQRLLTAQTEPGEDLRQLVLLYGWRPVVEATRHLLRSRDETRWQCWLDAHTDGKTCCRATSLIC
jgi:ATP-dependent helicase/nuclease subunit A